VASQQWSDAYVYFKHDEGVGSGPPAVDSFTSLVARQPGAQGPVATTWSMSGPTPLNTDNRSLIADR
jgi:hypothetical protein